MTYAPVGRWMAFNGKDLLAPAIQHSSRVRLPFRALARMPFYATLSAGYRFQYPEGIGALLCVGAPLIDGYRFQYPGRPRGFIVCEHSLDCRVSFSIPRRKGCYVLSSMMRTPLAIGIENNTHLLKLSFLTQTPDFSHGYRKRYLSICKVRFFLYLCISNIKDYDRRRVFQKGESYSMAIRTIPRVKCRANCEGYGHQWNAIPQLHKRLEATFGKPRNGYRKLPAETRQRVERNQTALIPIGIENNTRQI